MTDSKYFTTTKKGEIFELKSELNSEKKEKKREAVKKVRSLLNQRNTKNLHLLNKMIIIGDCVNDCWQRCLSIVP